MMVGCILAWISILTTTQPRARNILPIDPVPENNFRSLGILYVLAIVFSAVNQDFVAAPPHSDAAERAPRRREGASETTARLG